MTDTETSHVAGALGKRYGLQRRVKERQDRQPGQGKDHAAATESRDEARARSRTADTLAAMFDRLRDAAAAHDASSPAGIGP